ncbi:PadR family transcriptional regulator [Microbacterium sp. SLBN-154]|uniref:PadR family transcriptional regulator n=1 Tax=Microbacterium sp. SLBN-154 TaxID=2768458 RepID=UPI00114E949D|nr:PadR family transcriptional regulator [Microbacterium sp. SLBN-154]TQK20303.1 PadR family transcriptional regulator [Microbacterium sp. SLBN-154]
MSNSFFGEAFSGRGGSASGWPMSNIAEAMDQLRSAFEKGVGSGSAPRMNRGDVRTAVLTLLLERPMHGYQIIQLIEERSGGSWKPSAGSVYPTLQLLADEGLIEAKEADGRKTYSLTEGGIAEAEAAAERGAPWESGGASHRESPRMTALPKAGLDLAQAAAQVARSGSSAQVEEAVAVLEDARRRLYSILAQS